MRFEANEQVKTPWYKYYGDMKKHLDYPDTSIYDYLRDCSLDRPNLVAYNYYDTTATYRELIDQIDEAANALEAIGIRENDKVTICMPNTPEAICSFYAINKIGAVANMVHPLSGENEIKYYFEISESKAVICINVSLEKVMNVIEGTKIEKVIVVSPADSMPIAMKVGYQVTQGRKVKMIKDEKIITWKNFIKLAKNGSNFNAHHVGSDDCGILYSGGTTGYPKGIVLTNLNFNALAMQSVVACDCLHEGMRILSIMPIFHGFGLGICIHTALTFGATAIILPQFSVKTFDKLFSKYRPNVIAGVPTLYEALMLNEKIKTMDLSYLELAISGGDSLSISLKKKVDTFFKEHGANIQIREGYGLTECVTGSCLTPKDWFREGSIGLPYADTYYKIVSPNTHDELPYGEEGEIVLSGPSVMKCYLKEPKETAHTLQMHEDGLLWLHTGDLGYMDADGFIYFKQRLKRMIISSGYNVYPQYIENVIDSYPDVLMSTVIGIDHPYKKQVAKAFIVLKPGIEPTDELKDKIYEHCKKNLAKYSLPYEMEFRDALPKTLVGKVAYKVLEEEEKEKKQKEEAAN